MNFCPSHKNSYDSLELAQEALIQNHSRNHHHGTGGPINIYLCDTCGCYHFTSKGEVNKILLDPEIKRRITLERQANDWERKLR